MLLPHDGEAMYGGAVKHLAFGAPRSVDLVGVGARVELLSLVPFFDVVGWALALLCRI